MKKTSKEKVSDRAHFDFLTTGLACHALCLLENLGLLKKLTELSNSTGLSLDALVNYSSQPLLRAAFSTLVGAAVIEIKSGAYYLTPLGEQLAKQIGTFILPLVGYRKLLADQFHLATHPDDWKDSDIDFPAVALSSINFGRSEVDPALVDLFQALAPSGTICDLGCGTGEKLVNICKRTGCSGLGIEKEFDVIKAGNHFTAGRDDIEVIQGDIFNLEGVWEDVEIVLVSFVYHDITTTENCKKFLSSLRTSFPRLRGLVIVDIVSPSESLPTILPGFDYVHGLQGFNPRTYEETLQSFSSGGFSVRNEIKLLKMPNTFIWLLS